MAYDSKTFSRRAFVLGALQLSTMAVLGGRMAWLQIAQGPRYKMLSDKNRINLKMLAPSRGIVYDRFGIPLAVNSQNFRVQVIPEQAEDLEKTLRQLQELIRLDDVHIEKVLKQARRQAKFVPLEIRDDLDWEEVARIEVNLPELSGLSIDEGEVRSYPYGEASAHVVGYVGAPSAADVKNDPVFKLPGLKIGKTGLELSYEDDLRGQPGTAQVEVNVSGRAVRELKRNSSISGHDVTLALDAGLQDYVQKRLSEERSASAVVMDVHTGAVYALVSYPTFDPNLFTHGLSAEKWEALLSDPAHPLTNKAVAGQYPPASTFKMITALAGMELGKITAKRRVYCPGHYDFAGDRFHCWKLGGHGSMNIVDALQHSCDTYFYELATEIGIDRLADTARRFGLGHKLDFDLREERPGLVPDKDWKMGYFGESWRKGETIVSSIGQGYFASTPLQLAVMTARLVNGGYAVRPWLTGYIGQEMVARSLWPKMNIDDYHLHLIRKGMDRAVNDSDGTAYKSRITIPGMEMGGKTGTAQVRKITQRQRSEGMDMENMPWRHRHHALFVGYAPRVNPRYVCSVVVEHGIGGSVTAAPMARDILLQTQRRDPASSKFLTQRPQKG